MKKVYSIAGLIVELTGQRTLQQVAELPGFDIFEMDDYPKTNIDIHIYMDKIIDTAKLTSIYNIHTFRVLGVNHFFSLCKEGYLYEMYKPDGSKIISLLYDLSGSSVYTSSSNCEMWIKYAMWVAFTLPAANRKILPIHASAIVKDSKAILFLGESGTGKSTHSRLWLQHIGNSYLLNDDSPMLRLMDNMILIYGSPWSGKVHCYKQEAAPLKAMARINRYPENKISCSNKLASIGAIQPSFPPFLAYDWRYSGIMIRMIDRIVRDIPIYELKCRPDKQAAETAYAKIY